MAYGINTRIFQPLDHSRPPGAALLLPQYCPELPRWHGQQRHFSSQAHNMGGHHQLLEKHVKSHFSGCMLRTAGPGMLDD
jgi:hypothetical protein